MLTPVFQGATAMGCRTAFKKDEFQSKPVVKEMQEAHKKEVGGSMDAMGYPDMGNGRYSAQLSYGDWYRFNVAQRTHYNMIETSGPALATLLAGGLFYPITSAILGFTYGVGRIIYAHGYITGGPSGRLIGAVFADLAIFGLWGVAGVGGAYATFLKK